MLKNYPWVKRTLLALLSFIVAIIAFGFWFFSQIPASENPTLLKNTQPEQITYLQQGVKAERGKILAVVTSSNKMGVSGKSTGYELTELARAYYVFQANGFGVDIASPQGGEPPVVIDGDDMGEFDYAFLNDPVAQNKVTNSIPMHLVDREQYQGIYFVGGKGAMFDFPDNSAIQSIVADYFQQGKVIGAVCHGPAALVNVKLDNGSSMVANKAVSGFTNEEELLLIKDARTIFPFLLEDKLVEQGARFTPGPAYLEQISHDGNLITGQNPWSVWTLAELMVTQLGYTPIVRPTTGEENTISILKTYENKGYLQARAQIQALLAKPNQPLHRTLIAMHSIVALMQWELGKAVDMLKLLSIANAAFE